MPHNVFFCVPPNFPDIDFPGIFFNPGCPQVPQIVCPLPVLGPLQWRSLNFQLYALIPRSIKIIQTRYIFFNDWLSSMLTQNYKSYNLTKNIINYANSRPPPPGDLPPKNIAAEATLFFTIFFIIGGHTQY